MIGNTRIHNGSIGNNVGLPIAFKSMAMAFENSNVLVIGEPFSTLVGTIVGGLYHEQTKAIVGIEEVVCCIITTSLNKGDVITE